MLDTSHVKSAYLLLESHVLSSQVVHVALHDFELALLFEPALERALAVLLEALLPLVELVITVLPVDLENAAVLRTVIHTFTILFPLLRDGRDVGAFFPLGA